MLDEMEATPRRDLMNHPELKPYRPDPVGIQECCVYQTEGTNVFRWHEKRNAGFWYPVGPYVVLAEDKREGARG